MGEMSDEVLKKSYQLLEESKIMEAKGVLASALGYDFHNPEIKFAHWCCSYWMDFIQNLFPRLDPYEQGEGLVARWKSFKQDCEQQNFYSTKAVYSLQHGIFSLALAAYESVDDVKSFGQKADYCRKKGLCYKKLGKYENAMNLLSEANTLKPLSAEILAEMADCFALCGDDRNAKVLFREAFFVNASKVDLDFLDSELICSIIRQLKEKGFVGAVLQEWVPVYGVLYGVFNVKRELRVQEVARLRQDIFALENEIKDPSNDSKVLTPRLINMYFWLIDHYAHSDLNGGKEKITECLLQIRVHDESVYRMYTK